VQGTLAVISNDAFFRSAEANVDEEPAVDVVNKLGAKYFVVSSDYPHSDGAFPEAIEQFLSLSLSDEQRRQILWDNCARLYAIERPARPLSAEPRASAAE
jgi:predicted TIM-barrel fold metal-dependent hydrolase